MGNCKLKTLLEEVYEKINTNSDNISDNTSGIEENEEKILENESAIQEILTRLKNVEDSSIVDIVLVDGKLNLKQKDGTLIPYRYVDKDSVGNVLEEMV